MPRSLLPLPSLIRDMMTPRGMMRTPRSAFPSSTSLLDPLAGIAAWPEQMLQQMQQMPSILSLQEYQHTPKLDVAESKDRITIDAEMPGVRKEDVSLRIVDDPEHGVHNGSVLVLKGRTETKRDEGDIDALTKDMKETSGDTTVEKAITRPQYWFAERTVGEYQRVLRLPRNADTDKVKAEYRNGILHITVPKRELKQEDEAQAEDEEEQGKKVEIA